MNAINIESEFEVRCNGEAVAWTSGLWQDALNEAKRYAAIYAEDGPIEIFEVHKTYTNVLPTN